MSELEIIGIFYIKLQTEINPGQGLCTQSNDCVWSPKTKKNQNVITNEGRSVCYLQSTVKHYC